MQASMPTIKTVAVTGATGFVGRAVVRALLERGWSVRVLARDGSKARRVLPADRRLAMVQGSVLDGVSPARLLAGAEACVHLVGIIRPAPGGQTFERVHVEATRAMIDACRAAGVQRFAHMSALGVTPDGKAEYQRTKFEGEQLVRRSGLAWTVFRPGVIHGPEGELVGQIRRWCEGAAQPWVFIPYFTRLVDHDEGVVLSRVSLEAAMVQPVAVEDVAQCFARCLDRPQTVGEVYNVVGRERLTWKQFMTFFRDRLPHADRSLPVWGVPGPLAAAQAVAASAIGLGGLLPFDAGQAMMAQEDATADTDKLAAHLEIEPRGFAEVAGAYAAAME